jgi:hypothetical protein
MAIYIVEPAVEGAAEPAILDPPIGQRGQPVGTVQADQAGATCIVSEQHQIFAQHPYLERFTTRRDLGGEAHGLPVAPQILRYSPPGVPGPT